MKKFLKALFGDITTANFVALWNWFDGKKTVIGSTLLLIAPCIPALYSEFLTATWGIAEPAWVVKVTASLIWIGTKLTTFGLLHKVAKAADNYEPAPEPQPIQFITEAQIEAYAAANSMNVPAVKARLATDQAFAAIVQAYKPATN